MEGITVLYQEPIYKIICMIFGALISAICMSLKGTIIFFVLGVITILSIVVLDSHSSSTEELDHYEYKVTIDDSVPMKEFLSKYEIINQEGEIFTIVERENINENSK